MWHYNSIESIPYFIPTTKLIANMKTIITPANWAQIKGKLKDRYVKLTEADLKYTEGKMEAVLTAIQKKVGDSREMIDKFIDDYTATLSSHKASATAIQAPGMGFKGHLPNTKAHRVPSEE
jgi:uncharacterized protein YjbJ (UPF0337 family)